MSLILVALAVFAIGSCLLLWVVPKRQTKHIENTSTRLELECDSRRTLAQILGGFFLVGSLVVGIQTWQSSEERLITDRFTAAVGQLGSTSIAVRIGGIHALTRIACDSGRDQSLVADILLAFVRENTQHAKPAVKVLPLDVQTGLHALLIGDCLVLRSKTRRKLDLASLSLPGAQLAGARLSEANLAATVLTGANLIGADLRGANLSAADLSFALLKKADLTHAVLYEVNLKKAQLSGADLSRTELDDELLKDACVDDNTKLRIGTRRPRTCE